ncbi:hypothetical protein [Streptomyces sp. NPDC002067]
MRHPVRRSLAVAAAAAGLLAFGATAAQADDWQGTDKIGSQIFSAAEDGGRVVLPPSDDCDPGPGEICRVDPELPTGYSVKQASLRPDDEGRCWSTPGGRVVCSPVG